MDKKNNLPFAGKTKSKPLGNKPQPAGQQKKNAGKLPFFKKKN